MKYLITFIFFFGIFSVTSAEVANVGIVQGIWFSQDSYIEGDTIRIYTAVHNNTGSDVEGYVDFYNGSELLGTKHFTSLHGRITEVWFDVVARLGEQQFMVKITELTKNSPGKNPEFVTPRVFESPYRVVVVAPFESIEKKEVNNLNAESPGLIQEIFDILKGKEYQSDETSENVQEQESTKITDTSLHVDKKIVPPQYIEELVESYPVVARVTNPINDIQNVIVQRVQKEQFRFDERDQKNIEQEHEVIEGEKNSLSGSWIDILYIGFLWLVQKIFSSLILTLIFTFGIIFLILKLLFRIFGKRSSY